MVRRFKFIVAPIITMFILSSCSLFPSPNETITPPKENKDISASNKDITSIVNAFLPKGSVLIEPINKGIKPIQEFDLDKDGENEIFVSYKSDSQQITSGLMILKINGDKWEKVIENNDSFTTFEDIRIIDANTFPKVILIRTWDVKTTKTFSSISCWGDKFFQGIGMTFNELEIKDLNGVFGQDGKDELIFTIKSDSYSLDYKILRTGSRSFYEPSSLEFPEYQNKKIELYQSMIKSEPNKVIYYLQLFEAQCNLKMYNEALETISRGLKLKLSEKERLDLTLYKCNALNKLGKFNEAQEIISKLNISKDGEFGDIAVSADRVLAESYEGQKKYEKIREIYSSSSNYAYPEEIQSLDAKIAGDKILRYISENNGPNLISPENFEDFRKWGDGEGIEVIPMIPEGSQNNKIMLVQYYIFPEKAHGKTDVGSLGVYWTVNGKIYSQYFDDFRISTITSAIYSIDRSNVPTINLKSKINPSAMDTFPPNPIIFTLNIDSSFKLKNNTWIGI